MTEKEMDTLAEKIASHIDLHVCKFHDEEITALKSIVSTVRSVRSTALATTIGAFVLLLLGLIGAGILYRFGVSK